MVGVGIHEALPDMRGEAVEDLRGVERACETP